MKLTKLQKELLAKIEARELVLGHEMKVARMLLMSVPTVIEKHFQHIEKERV